MASIKGRFFLHKTAPTLRFLLIPRAVPGTPICSVQERCYALKTPVPVKWVRPERIPSIKPEKSGDLKPLVDVDKTEVPLEFRDSEELKTANDVVKKLFSLEYFPRKKMMDVIRWEYNNRVKRHRFDVCSTESQIAGLTVYIRDMQKFMDTHPTDKVSKVKLKEAIDKRRKTLKKLRNIDYKCFEWIIEKLDLIYKPPPPVGAYPRMERKRSLRLLTKEYCEEIVNKKLRDYRESLESEQENFLQDKIKSLKWIMKEEIECNVPLTVTEDDVKAAEQKLEHLRISRKKEVKTEDLDV